VTVPNSVISIRNAAFYSCTSLTSVTIPESVIRIGESAFSDCTGFTNLIIGKSVTTVGTYAFSSCGSLTKVFIPATVSDLGEMAFAWCTNLTAAYFEGNAPNNASVYDNTVFYVNPTTVYRLPGTSGWLATFGGHPTALWVLPYPVILNTAPNVGIQTNGFGFRISWATNASVVVEASTSLANPAWSPVSTNTLTEGWSYFSDPYWTNHPARFYRIRSP
jgi:hypothetical protein